MIRAASLIAAVAVGLVVASCGGDDDSSSATSVDAASTAPPMASDGTGATTAAEFNEADVEFAQGMIGHHEQAIEMSEIALDPAVGASNEVTDLAARIQAAQDPEIELMTGWLTAWGQPLTMDESGGHDMQSMDGMMTAEQMDALAASSGAAFDTMWLEMMIEHHHGAITMADDINETGANPDVTALADRIIATQQAEIGEMTALLEA